MKKLDELLEKTKLEGSDIMAVRDDDGMKKISFQSFYTSMLEKQIENLFLSRRTGKIYSTKIWKSSVNLTSEGIKMDDNEGLVCVPSTDTFEGQDDYAEIPLFQWLRCNFVIDENGKKIPTVLEGSGDYQTSGSADVGTLFMTPYYRIQDFDDYQIYSISDTKHDGFSEPEDAQGKPYVVVATYPFAKASDGVLRSQPGIIPQTFSVSANTAYNSIKSRGNVDGGGNCYQFISYLMTVIKYGSKSSQTAMAGCSSYNHQYESAVKSESAGNEFVLTSSQAGNFTIGANVYLGYKRGSDLSVDRGTAQMRAYGLRKITNITPSDSDTVILTLSGEPFATADVEDGGVTVPVMLSSWFWESGTTDKVIGHHDGSYLNNTNGKTPMRIHGIELMGGFYEVFTTLVVICGDDNSRLVYKRPYGTAFSTSKAGIESTYKYLGTIHNNNDATSYYTGDVDIVDECLIPSSHVSSTSYGVGDYCYYSTTTETVTREWLAFGGVGGGAGAGLACSGFGRSLGNANWDVGGRL